MEVDFLELEFFTPIPIPIPIYITTPILGSPTPNSPIPDLSTLKSLAPSSLEPEYDSEKEAEKDAELLQLIKRE